STPTHSKAHWAIRLTPTPTPRWVATLVSPPPPAFPTPARSASPIARAYGGPRRITFTSRHSSSSSCFSLPFSLSFSWPTC
ncbi:hypothetical protein VIGAN_03266900, partial [Vigna angularis var. angularis]